MEKKYYILCSGEGTHLASDIMPKYLPLELAKKLVDESLKQALASEPIDPETIVKDKDGLSVSACGDGLFHAWDILPAVDDEDRSLEAEMQRISSISIAMERETSAHNAKIRKCTDPADAEALNAALIDSIDAMTSSIRSITDRTLQRLILGIANVKEECDVAPLERQHICLDMKNDTYHVGILTEDGDAVLDGRNDVFKAEDLGTTWKISAPVHIKKEADHIPGIFHARAGNRVAYDPTYGVGTPMEILRGLHANIIGDENDGDMRKVFVRFETASHMCVEVFDNELIGPYTSKIALMTGSIAPVMVADIKMSGLRDAKFAAPRSRTFDIGTRMGRDRFVTAYLIDHVSGPKNRWNYILHVHDMIDNVEFYVGTKYHDQSDVVELLDNIVYDMTQGRI